MLQRKFIIDADTGSDDAVAILMALQEPTVVHVDEQNNLRK